MSGTLVKTDANEEDNSERIKMFIRENFNIEDIKDLVLRPEDDDSDEEEDEFLNNKRTTIDEIYDI